MESQLPPAGRLVVPGARSKPGAATARTHPGLTRVQEEALGEATLLLGGGGR